MEPRVILRGSTMAMKPSLTLSHGPFSNCRSRLRIAIVATPRSGNTWLKGLLGSLYDMPDIICDRPDEVPWETLPDRCVLQLHWCPEPELIELFQRHDIRPVTIARHPLDTLISMLHFCTTWPGTSLWFGGRCGNEDSIRGCLPASPDFLAYATGPRARALMSISREWWDISTCHTLCYEQLVKNPESELERLGNVLEPVSPQTIRAAVDGNSLERTRPKTANQHHWMGTSAHWKRLLPASVARQIAQAHAESMELLNYDGEPDETLTATQADLNWLALEVLSLRQEVARTRTQMFETRDRLAKTDSLLARAREIVRPLKPLHEFGRRSVRLAQQLRASALGHPRLTAALGHLVRPFARKAG